MNYVEYDEKMLQDFEYETTIQSSDGEILGVCELGKATIQLINEENNYSSFKNHWIKTPRGSFYIYDAQPVQERINIKLDCYDIKYKLDTPYDSSKHTFPCTLKEWRNSIFDDCEVEYDNSDFPYSDMTLNAEPYVGDNPSNRNVISLIGQAGLSIIITDSNDKFYFDWFSDVTHTIDDWLELTTEKQLSEAINVVVLGRGDVEDNVYFPEEKPSNPIEFRIDNNYILDPQREEDTRYDIIETFYNRMNGFQYLTFNMRAQQVKNKLSIKLGQKVKYIDIWDNELIAPVMTKKTKWLSGDLNDSDNYEITLSASPIKETSTEFKYASSVHDDLLKVERLANKIEGEIKDVVEKTSNYGNQLSQMTQDIKGFDYTVKDIQENIYNLENNFKITVEGVEGVINKSGNNLLYGTSLYDLTQWGFIYGTNEQHNEVEIIDNDYTKSNFLSKRAMNVNYTTFKSTIVDKNMDSLTLSMKILNNLEMGYFNIVINERINNEITNQINSNIYIDDYKNLDKFVATFPINKVDGVCYDGIFQTKPILIGKDDYSIISEEEPMPSKGLYWIKESTDEIRRAKYNDDEFETWELIPWTYTQAKNNATLVDDVSVPTIPVRGNITIGDVKLEYGDLASDWSLNQNELYGTNYKIGEEGIEFKKENKKTVHDEDGISVYKNDQLTSEMNAERVFSEKVECETLDVDGLITKKLSNNEYIRFIRN